MATVNTQRSILRVGIQKFRGTSMLLYFLSSSLLFASCGETAKPAVVVAPSAPAFQLQTEPVVPPDFVGVVQDSIPLTPAMQDLLQQAARLQELRNPTLHNAEENVGDESGAR